MFFWGGMILWAPTRQICYRRSRPSESHHDYSSPVPSRPCFAGNKYWDRVFLMVSWIMPPIFLSFVRDPLRGWCCFKQQFAIHEVSWKHGVSQREI